MRIARVRIRNFRCIRQAEIFPSQHNVLLGPNNSGKTAVLEALNLLLNPEVSFRTRAINENDFYRRQYLPETGSNGERPSEPSDEEAQDPASSVPENAQAQEKPRDTTDETAVQPESEAASSTADGSYPTIYVEAVLTDLDEADEDIFADWLVPWQEDRKEVVEQTPEGKDPFEDAVKAVRVFFEGWFDPEEDDFLYDTYFLTCEGLSRDECKRFRRDQKRHIGFLIYRDFRALTRPVTLDARSLFGRLVMSQAAKPRRFEEVLSGTANALDALTKDEDFASLLNSYKSELERFLPLTSEPTSRLSFDLTDRTRDEIRAVAQMYTWDRLPMPIQRMGAGTRSLAILSILTLIMRRRGRGILALEEPETFLFPHAQRRVIDECTALADQTFVTTHSPYVLERIPIEGVGRIQRDDDGTLAWSPLGAETVKKCNLYSRFLRKAHCEALVGSVVVIVEGESDRWWLSGVSRALNRESMFDRRQEALELQGVAIASADGFGEMVRLGSFFHEAGLKVICLFDRIGNDGLRDEAAQAPFPCLFHRYKGLEGLLAKELPVAKLRQFLLEAPHAKNLPLDQAKVDALDDEAARAESEKQLVANKGAAFMHEWLISSIERDQLPRSLAAAVEIITRFTKDEVSLGDCDIVPGKA